MIGRCMFTLVAVALACGPLAPAETTGEPESTSSSTAAPESTSTATTSTTGATTGAPVTTGEPATTDPTSTPTTTAATTTTTTTDASSTGPPADSGVCIADPAAGICSESCDHWIDCCRCGDHTIAITDPQECRIALGIVADHCPWGAWNLRLDGQFMDQGSDCDEPDAQWTQSVQDGDRVIDLCGDTCAGYLDGKFAEMQIEVFCEVA